MTIDVDALKARNPISDVVGSFTRLTRAGSTYRGKCPVHGGDGDNLVVYPESDSWHCFSCNCHDGHADQIGFLELMLGTDFKGVAEYLGAAHEWKPELVKPARPPQPERVTSKPPPDAGVPKMAIKGLGEPVATWEYKDFDGGTLGYVARYETEQGKEIRQFSWGARGTDKPDWGCGHFSKPRPCFHLERLADNPDKPVLITEGEKACEAAQTLLPGYVCVTWPGGAQAWKHADFSPLSGKTVLLWPDNDQIGIDCMSKLAQVLADPAGLACKVRIIDPSGQEPGADAADWQGTTAELVAWAKPRASDVTYSSAAQEPIPLNAGASLSSPLAPPLEPLEPPTGDLQPEPPPIDGTTAMRPAKPPRRPTKPRLASVEGNTVTAPDLDADGMPEELSDSHLAAEFVNLHGEDWRYVGDWSSSDKACWMQWRDDLGGWARDKVDGYWPLIEMICCRAREWPAGRSMTPADRRKLTGAGKYAAVAQCVRKSTAIASESADWDTDKWVLGIPGGWVDLRDGSLHPGDKSRHISMRTSIAPKEGLHPLFDMVIERPAHGSAEMLVYLWNMCGYMLTGDVSQERFFYLIGPQNSGKSTLAGVLFDILGDYAGVLRPDALIDTQHPQHTQQWAMQQNKRMVLTSEMKGNSRWSEDLVKRITDGSPITAHAMRQNDITWRPHFKLFVDGGQEIPNLQNPEGMERRLDLIEYPPLDGEKDLTLKARLIEEYPAILHSLIVACQQYQEHGLPRPKQVKEDSAEYMSAQDILGNWIAQRIERASGQTLKTSVAREDLQKWAEQSGEVKDGRRFMSPRLFALRMKARGYQITKSGNKYFVDTQLRDNRDMFDKADDERSPPPSYDMD